MYGAIPDISEIFAGTNLVETPDRNGLFITGRGCKMQMINKDKIFEFCYWEFIKYIINTLEINWRGVQITRNIYWSFQQSTFVAFFQKI